MLRRLIGTAGDIQEMAYTSRGRRRRDARPRRVADLRGRRTPRRRHARAAAPRARSRRWTSSRRCTTATRRSSACPPATTISTSCCSGCSRRPSSIVAARPGQGKTSFALGAALHVALDGRKPVLFFSMEMGHLELTKRLLAAEAQIDARKLADRQALRARVAEAQPGGRPARRGAVLHRRQPALHGDGDARQGAAHQGALRRPRPDRRRLPAADVDAGQRVGEPPGRGVGAVARPEDPRPRARLPGR